MVVRVIRFARDPFGGVNLMPSSFVARFIFVYLREIGITLFARDPRLGDQHKTESHPACGGLCFFMLLLLAEAGFARVGHKKNQRIRTGFPFSAEREGFEAESI